jgi:hypothetical protein
MRPCALRALEEPVGKKCISGQTRSGLMGHLPLSASQLHFSTSGATNSAGNVRERAALTDGQKKVPSSQTLESISSSGN